VVDADTVGRYDTDEDRDHVTVGDIGDEGDPCAETVDFMPGAVVEGSVVVVGGEGGEGDMWDERILRQHKQQPRKGATKPRAPPPNNDKPSKSGALGVKPKSMTSPRAGKNVTISAVSESGSLGIPGAPEANPYKKLMDSLMVESANKFGGPGPAVGGVVPSCRQLQQQLRHNEGDSTVVHSVGGTSHIWGSSKNSLKARGGVGRGNIVCVAPSGIKVFVKKKKKKNYEAGMHSGDVKPDSVLNKPKSRSSSRPTSKPRTPSTNNTQEPELGGLLSGMGIKGGDLEFVESYGVA